MCECVLETGNPAPTKGCIWGITLDEVLKIYTEIYMYFPVFWVLVGPNHKGWGWPIQSCFLSLKSWGWPIYCCFQSLKICGWLVTMVIDFIFIFSYPSLQEAECHVDAQQLDSAYRGS